MNKQEFQSRFHETKDNIRAMDPTANTRKSDKAYPGSHQVSDQFCWPQNG